MDAMFQEAHAGPHGDTLYAEDPTLAAMKQAAYLRMCDITAEIIWQSDGSVTVHGLALAPITYEKEQQS